MTKARILSIAVISMVVTAAAASNGEPAKPMNAEQQKARAEFDEKVKPYLETFKNQCGNDLAVTADFENYDAAAWKKAEHERDRIPAGETADERKSRENRYVSASETAAGQCIKAILALKNVCETRRERAAAAVVRARMRPVSARRSPRPKRRRPTF